MTSELEAAFRRVLKSVVRQVADEVLQERQSTDCGNGSKRPDQGDPLLLRASEAAKRLAISERHLFTITSEGLLPCVRVGRLVRYSVETIEQWIRDSESADSPRPGSRGAAHRSKKKPERPTRVSKSKQKESPKPKPAKPSGSSGPATPTRAAAPDSRQSGGEEKRPSPFDSLLKEVGVDLDDVGPLTNGDLMRIAEVDLPTMHGWLYLRREMPEAALEKLRRHFKKAHSEQLGDDASTSAAQP